MTSALPKKKVSRRELDNRELELLIGRKQSGIVMRRKGKVIATITRKKGKLDFNATGK